MNTITIGITMGDPAGVGPEIVTKMLSGRHQHNSGIQQSRDDSTRFVIVGDSAVIRQQVKQLGLNLQVRTVGKKLSEEQFRSGTLHVCDSGTIPAISIEPGEKSKRSGEASMLYNREGASLALSGEIDALLTAPVTKHSVKMAGYTVPGQAEYFAHLAGVGEYTTILIYRDFMSALFTTHLPLVDACRKVKKDSLSEMFHYLHDKRLDLGKETLKMGIAALNPHGGDGGIMGREELDEIIPAVTEAREQGIDISGPYPVNAIISPPYDGKDFDLVIALYHDQVVARMNMLETTTWTFGLPFIRTSVGHGSAHDIAGRGIADIRAISISLEHTIKLAKDRKQVKTGTVVSGTIQRGESHG